MGLVLALAALVQPAGTLGLARGGQGGPDGGVTPAEAQVATTTALTSPATDKVPGGPVTLTATVTPNPGGGDITFKDPYGGDLDVAPVDGDGTASIVLDRVAEQMIVVQAHFGGTGSFAASASVTRWILVSWPTAVEIAVNRPTSVFGELPVVLVATVTSQANYTPVGTVTFHDQVGSATPTDLGTVAVDESGKATFSSSALAVGSHQVTATFKAQSNAYLLDGESAPFAFDVIADTSVGTTFGASIATFYPVKDGFKDTVRLAGVSRERLAISIVILNSQGQTKRTLAVGTKKAGSWGVTWDGKDSRGRLVGAGTYTAKAMLRDDRGNKAVLKAKVVVSSKKATWVAGTPVTIRADRAALFVDPGNIGKLYTSPDYSHGIIFDAGEMIRGCTECGWAGGRFIFTLTKAPAYKSVYIQIKGHGFEDREHPGTSYLVNPRTKQHEDPVPNCEFDQKDVTCGHPVPVAYISASHKIEFWEEMTQAWGDAYDLAWVKLTYKYAVLR